MTTVRLPSAVTATIVSPSLSSSRRLGVPSARVTTADDGKQGLSSSEGGSGDGEGDGEGEDDAEGEGDAEEEDDSHVHWELAIPPPPSAVQVFLVTSLPISMQTFLHSFVTSSQVVANGDDGEDDGEGDDDGDGEGDGDGDGDEPQYSAQFSAVHA